MALRVTSALFTGYMVCSDPKTQGWLKNGFRLILGKTSQIIKHIIYYLISLTYKYGPHCPLAESPIFCSDLKRNHAWVRRWERGWMEIGTLLVHTVFCLVATSPALLSAFIHKPFCRVLPASTPSKHLRGSTQPRLAPQRTQAAAGSATHALDCRCVPPCSAHPWPAASSCVFPPINSTIFSSFITESRTVNLMQKLSRQGKNPVVNGRERVTCEIKRSLGEGKDRCTNPKVCVSHPSSHAETRSRKLWEEIWVFGS